MKVFITGIGGLLGSNLARFCINKGEEVAGVDNFIGGIQSNVPEKAKLYNFDIRDLDLLKKGAKLLIGEHDFSTFRSSSCSAKSPIRKINNINIKKKGDIISIEFKSQSFLQNQVRSMVGCLKYLSCKIWNLDNFKKVFKSRSRKLCAPPAPACGLYLVKIKY